MKVFISWSGDKSKALGSAFRDWLPGVIQAVKPYFSPDDIAKGSRWGPEISKELDASSVGVICLTSDNLTAPWIMFEAGALAKRLDKARVCPIVFGVNPTDVKDPLAQFQAARFERDEIRRVIKMINSELGAEALASDVLDSVFDMWWPKLEERVQGILSSVPAAQEQPRTDRDILEEVLSLTRMGARVSRRGDLNPGAIRALIRGYSELVDRLEETGALPLFGDVLEGLLPALQHIAHRTSDDPEVERRLEFAIRALRGHVPEDVSSGPTGPQSLGAETGKTDRSARERGQA